MEPRNEVLILEQDPSKVFSSSLMFRNFCENEIYSGATNTAHLLENAFPAHKDCLDQLEAPILKAFCIDMRVKFFFFY